MKKIVTSYHSPARKSYIPVILPFVMLMLCNICNVAKANTYYWFGGSGDVSQVAHWSQTSGNSGALLWGVIPSATDDVIFDANSGFTAGSHIVTNTSSTFNFRNMTWTGALNTPIFTSNQTINCNGSLTLVSGMTWTGSPFFLSPGGVQTISTNGVTIGGNITFNSASTWNLLGALTSSGTVNMNLGTLNTNSFAVTIAGGVVTANTANAINLGSSTVSCAYFDSNGAGCTFNAGTSIITTTSNDGSAYAIASKNGDIYNNVIINSPSNIIFGSPSGGHARFASVTAAGPVRFTGLDTIGTLSLSNATYGINIGAANTLTVTGSLNTTSVACSTPAQLYSLTPGTPAFIKLPAGTTINNFIIQDITAAGAPTASSSLDNGDNTGWVFSAGTINTLFWIGGSGTYTDPTHWSLTSGGPAANCVPTPYTNVFFDAGSGFTGASKTVTMDITNYSQNMIWAGSAVAPIISVNSNKNIYIYGSLVLQNGMVGTGNIGSLNFNSLGTQASPTLQTITSNGVLMPVGTSTVRFGGYATWTLQDAFSAPAMNLDMAYGTLNTNNQAVTITNLVDEGLAAATFPAVLNLGSSVVTVNGSVFNTNASNISLNAGTSLIKCTAVGGLTISPKAGNLYYNVEFDNTNAGNGIIAGAGGATFNKITYTIGGGQFTNSNTIDSLILAAGNVYTFNSGTTQNITMAFSGLNPACTSALTTITSSSPPTQATLNIALAVNGTGIADLAGSIVTAIKGTGTGTLKATSSIDNGSNSGIAFTASGSSSAPLYWVGGTGNWNDATHWSYASGGAGGACLPLSTNSVYFDNNSFSAAGQTVTIDNTAYADSMTWSGISAAHLPVLANPAGKFLNLYNSLILMPGMTATGSFNFNYKSVNNNSAPASWPTQTINTNGVLFPTANSTFNGFANWGLLNSYTENGGNGDVITLGTLNTNNFSYTTRSLNISNGTLNAGTSNIILLAGVSTVLAANAAGATLNAANATINFPGGGAGGGVTANLKTGETVGTINFTGNGNVLNLGGAIVDSLNFRGTGSSDQINGGGGIVMNAFFKENSLFGTSTNFGNLSVTPGTTNIFTAGVTQNITGTLTANGNPCNPITLQSTSGTQAILNYTGSPKTIAFARISGINVLPAGATGTLAADNNSTNNGNNTNITFAGGSPGIIGLGPSSLALTCGQYPYSLNTSLFFADAAATYKWYNVSTGPAVIATTSTLSPTAAGIYAVAVTYGNGAVACVVPDTIALTESFPAAIDSGGVYVVLNGTAPLVFFIGSGGTAPYTFTYNINGGANMTVASVGASNQATVAQPTSALGTFQYNLVSVYDNGVTGCNTSQSSLTTVNVVIALPISLVNFIAQKQGNEALLSWATDQEINSNYFGVERSANGNAWVQIGQVPAAGSSSLPLYYSFNDNKPFDGSNYYRLRLVDVNGKSVYSVTKLLSFDGSTQIAALPNPVDNTLYVTGMPAGAELRLLSADGRTIMRRPSQQSKEVIDMSSFVRGIYFLEVRDKTSGNLLGNFKVIKE